MTSGEWKSMNRRTALAHAVSRGEGFASSQVLKEAEEFRKFLDGERQDD